MQNFSEKIEVGSNEKFGRHLVATIELAPGEMVLEEKPLLVAPHWDCDQMKCSNCYLDSFVMCKKCQLFPLCMDCTSHCEYDCEFFRALIPKISKNLLVKNYAIFAALKMLLLLENPETAVECEPLFNKPINLVEYQDTEMWQEHELEVIAPLLRSGIVDAFKRVKVTSDFLHEVCIRIDTNAFEVTSREGDSLKGVYVYGAKLPHNCVPNTVTALDLDFQMRIYAAVPIKRKEIIYNSYVNPLMGTSQRQHHLRMTRNIRCACTRCLDPTELGTHMSSVKCKNCSEGYAVCQQEALAQGKLGDWVCDQCQGVICGIEVRKTLAELSEAMVDANGNLHSYDALLTKYSPTLHPNHFLIIDIKQNINALLRAMLMRSTNKAGKKVLARRVQLCEEVLPVVRAVVPGISKLYAIALFEYLIPFLELAELELKAKDLTNDSYYIKLQKGRDMAAEAADMLNFEPENSPEGHLAQRIAMEQKRIGEQLKKFSVK